MSTVVKCDGCNRLIGAANEALTIHLPMAGLVWHSHDEAKCMGKIRNEVKAARKAAASGPDELEALRAAHRGQVVAHG